MADNPIEAHTANRMANTTPNGLTPYTESTPGNQVAYTLTLTDSQSPT